MEGRIYALALLCLVLSGVGAVQVRIPQELYEHLEGDNVTLPCKFTPARPLNPRSLVIISWSTVTDTKQTLILTHYSTPGVTDIKSTYEGRASVDVDILSGKANLKLSSVTLDDSMVYECRVMILGDDEGNPADTARLMVRVLSGVGALQVKIPQELYEHLEGDNVTLPCKFTPARPLNPRSLVIISWSTVTDTTETLILTHYSTPGFTDIKSTYEGRASVDVDILSGKANLKLSSVTLSDSMVYECRVMILGDDEGNPADTARLVVLGAPSTPICKIQGVAEYHQNINLTCVSEEGWPRPTYRWETRDVWNKSRILDPRATQRGGVLSLHDISIHTSGYYICTSANKVRSASCNITIAVRPPAVVRKWPTLDDLLS